MALFLDRLHALSLCLPSQISDRLTKEWFQFITIQYMKVNLYEHSTGGSKSVHEAGVLVTEPTLLGLNLDLTEESRFGK